MVYKVIGLMSGSSLDGLDIAHVQLEEIRGQWSFELLNTECIPYDNEWAIKLQLSPSLSASEFLKLHTAYGRYTGGLVNSFISKYDIQHQVHFIASHGHTVFHDPARYSTFQLGDGAAIAATTGLPVISDLRSLDVALGGQGAPIVPIGDKLLFGTYDYLLNLGGIANITVWKGGQPYAWDVCPANQVLNILAMREGFAMDEDGKIAASRVLLPGVLSDLDDDHYYSKQPPKSLSNDEAKDIVFPKLLESNHANADLLHTSVVHIAHQVAEAVKHSPHNKDQATILVTGGGAFNKFLVAQLEKVMAPLGVTVHVPDARIVKYKEALVMALIGTLRWREEVNVLSSVTGASKDSVGGALWLG